MSYITSDQTGYIVIITLGVVFFSLYAEKWKIGQLLSSAMIVMLLGLLLANLTILPTKAPVYSYIYSILVPMALPLFLFEAHWKKIIQGAGRLMRVFLAGAIGVITGAFFAAYFIDIGPNTPGWAGTFAASYIGGTVNFVNVSSALVLPENEIAIALTTDTVVGLVLLMALVISPSLKIFSKFLEDPQVLNPIISDSEETDSFTKSSENYGYHIRALWTLLGIIISIMIYFTANFISEKIGIEDYRILIITLIALAFTNLFPRVSHKFSDCYHIGVVCMLIFFFSVGTSANIATIAQSGSSFVLFLTTIVIFHLFAIITYSRIFKHSLNEVIIASCACAIGPTVAAGIAASKQWRSLITPGILCGIFGYAIANFIGVIIARILA